MFLVALFFTLGIALSVFGLLCLFLLQVPGGITMTICGIALIFLGNSLNKQYHKTEPPKDDLQKCMEQLSKYKKAHETAEQLIAQQKNQLDKYEELVSELESQIEVYKKKLELAESLIDEHELQESLYEKKIALLTKRLSLYEPDITKEG